MARLEYRGTTYHDDAAIRDVLGEHGVPFERWPLHGTAQSDDQVLKLYHREVERLSSERGYISVDLVALNPATASLPAILAKFDKEHHHVDDEVRFTVEGEGVFEIETKSGDFLKFTATPGDLIVIPAYRRHMFYLTQSKMIRCIRLFLTKAGWEAIYEKSA